MKATIDPTAISIQFWPSKPRKLKCEIRNSTTRAPYFLCRIGILAPKRYYFYTSNEAGRVGLRIWQVSLVILWRYTAFLEITEAGAAASSPCGYLGDGSPVSSCGGAWPEPHERGFKLTRAKRGTHRQQSVEFGGIVTDLIGRSDEDLPTLFRKSPSLGDGNDHAQPDRRR
jgi:hypothetical protein